jgi:hypothetical protein
MMISGTTDSGRGLECYPKLAYLALSGDSSVLRSAMADGREVALG